jgi:hypothetical protein
MIFRKLRALAQTVGLATSALLMIYGAISVFYYAESAYGSPIMQAGASGSVPPYLNYQGILRDPEGNLMSGLHDMTFRIYDRVSAPQAEAVWSEVHEDVTVRDGQFSVLLGNTTPLPSTTFYGPDTFIGVTVAPFDEMVPRQRFASVPFAIYADHASSLTSPNGTHDEAVSVTADGKVGIGTSSPGYLFDVNGRMRVREGGGSGGIWFADGSGSTDYGFVGMQGQENVGFYGNAGAKWGFVMNIANGKTGIGTITPNHQLSVIGGPSWTDSNWVGSVEIENRGAIGWRTNSSDQAFGMGQGNSGFYMFRTTDQPGTSSAGITTDIFIDNNGRVSVGDDLNVDGDAEVSGDLTFGSLNGFTVSNAFEALGTNGTNADITLMSSAKSICFLTTSVVRNADDEGEDVGCEVYKLHSNWKLRARSADDANALCRATCLSWD